MSRRTHYLVQTAPTLFAHDGGPLGFVEGVGTADAAQLSIHEAGRVYREFRAAVHKDGPRRYPRILKITIETRTITAPNRKGER